MHTLHNILTYYLLAINLITFIVYGVDKYKAKKAKWRISEATLLLMAAIGGSIGAWLGMKFGITKHCTKNSNMASQPFCYCK